MDRRFIRISFHLTGTMIELIEGLVKEGWFLNISDFLRFAMLNRLARDEILLDFIEGEGNDLLVISSVRLPTEIYERVKGLVKKGLYPTFSEFARQSTIETLVHFYKRRKENLYMYA